MEKHISSVRPFFVALSALMIVESCVASFRSATLLQALARDALFEASIVVLVLGVILGIASGGGAKHLGSPPAVV